MLIEKKAVVGDIVAARLISGEEVVGTLKRLGETDVEITKPLVLGLQQMQNPTTRQVETGMAFAPFMLSLADDGGVTFELAKIVTFIKVRDEIRNGYIQNTTGMELPEKPSLVV